VIVTEFKSLPPGDAWEGFAADIQRGESFVYEEYERLLERFCESLVRSLKDHELELLWYGADASFDHDDDNEIRRCEWEQVVSTTALPSDNRD
jgi:hypothetical protein